MGAMGEQGGCAGGRAADESQIDLDREARAAPRDDPARQLPPCDLVMKGGITSGVVYPGAVLALAGGYRLANVGGSSAGALAAGIAAAAEYGRQRGGPQGGMVAFREQTAELASPGRLVGLLQPTPATRPVFDAALAAAEAKARSGTFAAVGTGTWRLLRTGAWRLLARRPLALGALLAAIAVAAAVIVATVSGWPFGLPTALAIAVAVGGALAVALAALAAVAIAASLPLLAAGRGLADSGFGMCPGGAQPGGHGTPLAEWIDAAIQACAGHPEETVTLGMLDEAGVSLRTMTTDVTAGRPIAIPDDLAGYSFKPCEWRELLPEKVIVDLVRASAGPDADAAVDFDSAKPHPLCSEAAKLPAIVAVRLSLSFPGLISAVPVYRAQAGGGGPRRHLLSDGGIGSNFPVHFFDAWFPARPTFGLDLVPGTDGAVAVGSNDEPLALRWSDVDGMPGFLARVRDSMQNWRDTMQSELPGFRDRVCRIQLAPHEGGLNLDMDSSAIDRLMRRGFRAGQALRKAIPPESSATRSAEWKAHCRTRFDMLMARQAEGLWDVDDKIGWFLDELRTGDAGPHPNPRRAASHVALLLWLARRWKRAPLFPDDHHPRQVMRIVPRA